MKKSLFVIAACVMVLSSCSDNETLREAVSTENVPFTFAAYSNKATKADSHNNLDFFYKTFNVYGWKKLATGWVSDPVFNNTTNEYFAADGNGTVIYLATDGKTVSDEWKTTQGDPAFPAWYYEGIRYFDKMATDYQFCAYAPIAASAEVKCDNTGVITIGKDNAITVESTNLMATPATSLAYTGFTKDYMTATSTAKASAVSLEFSHELAKFNIQLVLDNSVTTLQDVIGKELSIKHLKGTSYYESNKENADGYLSGWHTPTGEIAYSLTGVGGNGYKMNGTTAGTDNFSGYYVMERLMIPQTAAKNTEDCQLAEFAEPCVYVKYTIGSEVFEGHYTLANLFAGSAADYDFLGGNEYTLTITVGPKPIYFTATVATWANHDANLAAD